MKKYMFDDQMPNKNQADVPANLPLAEPEDMFVGVDKETAPAASHSALSAGVLTPKQPEGKTAGANIKVLPDLEEEVKPKATFQEKGQESYTLKGPSLTRGLVVSIVAILIIAAVGAGGWWLYNKFFKEETVVPDMNAINANEVVAPTMATTPVETSTEVANGGEAAVAPTEDVGKQIVDDEVLFGEPVDKDGDGLDDTREAELGTDPNNWDSDKDELSDGDEVIIWKTNPLNSDSDGDSYLDGLEVKNGYNPAGPGKIFEPPKQ